MLDDLEQYQVEILIERLEHIYPNEVNEYTIPTIKVKVLENNTQDFSALTKEINELFQYNVTKLRMFLEKYQVEIGKEWNLEQFEEQKRGDMFPSINTNLDVSIEQLARITEGMAEEEIVEYLRLHGKNPGEIMMILLSLKENKKQLSLETPKIEPTTVNLKTPKVNKMAAFVNTLTLAFLVGAFSGIAFFIMLHIILQAL